MKKIVSLLLIILLSGCATGTTLITGTKREPVPPESVKVYSSRPVGNYMVIGSVSSQGSGLTYQRAQDNVIEELKKRAGEIGANGIVIQQMSEWTIGIKSMISAEAVYVP